jgi:hypothetical protein
VTITLRAHSLVEKAEPGPSSLLHTTLEGPTKYVNARWMQSLHGFVHGIQWIMFHVHLDCFQKPPLGGRPNTKPEDHDTPNAHHRRFTLIHHAWKPAWIKLHWNSIWLRARSHMTSHDTREFVATLTWCWRFVGTAFWTLSFGLSQFPRSRLLARVWSGPDTFFDLIRSCPLGNPLELQHFTHPLSRSPMPCLHNWCSRLQQQAFDFCRCCCCLVLA